MYEQPNPFRPKEDLERQYDMEVFIDQVEESGVGGGVASFLQGHVVYNNEKFPFDAIAYGRIGGQNVSPTLAAEAMKRLQDLKVDLELFTAQLQRKLVEGELTANIPPGTPPPDLQDNTR